jgi:hypothetical protein
MFGGRNGGRNNGERCWQNIKPWKAFLMVGKFIDELRCVGGTFRLTGQKSPAGPGWILSSPAQQVLRRQEVRCSVVMIKTKQYSTSFLPTMDMTGVA